MRYMVLRVATNDSPRSSRDHAASHSRSHQLGATSAPGVVAQLDLLELVRAVWLKDPLRRAVVQLAAAHILEVYRRAEAFALILNRFGDLGLTFGLECRRRLGDALVDRRLWATGAGAALLQQTVDHVSRRPVGWQAIGFASFAHDFGLGKHFCFAFFGDQKQMQIFVEYPDPELANMDFFEWLMEGSRVSPTVSDTDFALTDASAFGEVDLNDELDEYLEDIDQLLRWDPAEEKITRASNKRQRKRTEMSRLTSHGWVRERQDSAGGKRARYQYVSPHGTAQTSLKAAMKAIRESLKQ